MNIISRSKTFFIYIIFMFQNTSCYIICYTDILCAIGTRRHNINIIFIRFTIIFHTSNIMTTQ